MLAREMRIRHSPLATNENKNPDDEMQKCAKLKKKEKKKKRPAKIKLIYL
jgi:hypothetical protein